MKMMFLNKTKTKLNNCSIKKKRKSKLKKECSIKWKSIPLKRDYMIKRCTHFRFRWGNLFRSLERGRQRVIMEIIIGKFSPIFIFQDTKFHPPPPSNWMFERSFLSLIYKENSFRQPRRRSAFTIFPFVHLSLVSPLSFLAYPFPRPSSVFTVRIHPPPIHQASLLANPWKS